MVIARMLSRSLALAVGMCLCASAPAQANDTIKINRNIPYLDETVGTPEVRNECDWNTSLVDYLVRFSKGRVEVTDDDLTKVPDKTLTIVITHVHSSGGGAFSGPKWATIHGQLKENGQVVKVFSATSHTISPFRITSCGSLTKMSKQLGNHVAGWLKRPVNNARLGDSLDGGAPPGEAVDSGAPAAEQDHQVSAAQ
jgi:hypothetical protein